MGLSRNSTREDAANQYKDSLKWWASNSALECHLEALEYLLLEDFSAMSIGGQNFTRKDMEAKAERLRERALALLDQNRSHWVKATPSFRFTGAANNNRYR